MSNREVMQQALEALTIYSDAQCSLKGRNVITALKTALEQQQAEPTPWRDMVVVSLVREGIDKHKARELADHFAAQRPWVGLTDEDWAAIADMPDTFDQGVAWAAARLKEKNSD